MALLFGHLGNVACPGHGRRRVGKVWGPAQELGEPNNAQTRLCPRLPKVAGGECLVVAWAGCWQKGNGQSVVATVTPACLLCLGKMSFGV